MGINKKSLSEVFCFAALFVGLLLIFLLPLEKDIWYDESISVLCSKGISYETSLAFTGRDTVTAGEISRYNTFLDVYVATVRDNANSFLYNVGLHWFTGIFGNSLGIYVLFSKLLAAITLLVSFQLARMLMGYHPLTGIATLLLMFDGIFLGMSHEVRAYIMGMLFAALTGLSVLKCITTGISPRRLLTASLWAVAAILCHFLSVYVILSLFAFVLVIGWRRLFTVANIAAVAIPVLLLGVYFYLSLDGLKVMQGQNDTIAAKVADTGHQATLGVVLTETLRLAALDFKLQLVSFAGNSLLIITCSFALVLLLFIWSLKVARTREVRINLLFLFCAGISGSLFLAFLCLRSGHLTAIYGRYHSFCIPFATLFSAYALFVLFQNVRGSSRYAVFTFAALIIIPCTVYFVKIAQDRSVDAKYNQYKVAAAVIAQKADRVVVPHVRHAFLIQSFMPSGIELSYIIDAQATQYTLFGGAGVQKMNILADPE